ncbi:MAG: hypothetical protein ACI88H_003289 [Cocleimonas sp.]|jgi:hypothetical protein
MAKLKKTIKIKAIRSGETTYLKHFKSLDKFGAEAKAIRKYENENCDGYFYTAEIKLSSVLSILENLNSLRNREMAKDEKIYSIEADNYFSDKSIEDLKNEVVRLNRIINSQSDTIKKVQQLVNK